MGFPGAELAFMIIHMTAPTVAATRDADLILYAEWCSEEPRRRHRFELGATRARFLARACDGGWEILAETTRVNGESPFAVEHLSSEQSEMLAYYLDWDGATEGIDERFIEDFAELLAECREQTGDEPDTDWYFTDDLADHLGRDPDENEIEVARWAYAKRVEASWHNDQDRQREEMWKRNAHGLN